MAKMITSVVSARHKYWSICDGYYATVGYDIEPSKAQGAFYLASMIDTEAMAEKNSDGVWFFIDGDEWKVKEKTVHVPLILAMNSEGEPLCP